MARAVVEDARTKPGEWAKLTIPSLLYTVQNNMMCARTRAIPIPKRIRASLDLRKQSVG